MNVLEWTEVKNKNNDSLSLSCYPVHRYCLSRKISIEKEKEEKKKDKNMVKNTNQTECFSR